ncbi:MAG: RHS repeat-associated core domain-containing protein [Acidobacteria bacterium]|nr:RHS repeat-associated core domain-containing protein [Acidobacteriota bacterium]MDA1233376.1 RHS repeat-associated core domain-containing protein [Acidobacteriota bacterium]
MHHYDYRGNTVACSDGSGAVTGTVSYGPFGEIASRTGDSDSIFLHGGLWGVITDPDTELQYMRFRWYAPQLKQFLSKDDHIGDITDPASLNRYAYAGNNPVSFNDPTGELLNLIAAGIGAAVGAVVSVAVTVTVKAVKGERITAGDIIGSAVGGAVTGGLVGLCAGVCGPAALIAGGAAAGAVGAALGNASGQGIDIATGAQQGGFDAGEFGQEVAAGAIFGAIPFGGKGGQAVARGLGRGASGGAARGLVKGSVSKSIRKISTPAGELQLLVPKRDLGGRTIFPAITGKSAAAGAAQKAARNSAIARGLPIDLAVGLAEAGLFGFVTGDSGSPPPSRPQGAAAVLGASRDEINAGNRGVYGEFVHWKLYQSFHLLTGTPLPNNPNSPLSEF